MSTELVQLRSFYAPPSEMLLALDDDGTAVGVVALLVTGSTGEVRRLFVVPGQRTGGLGRQLVERLIADARDLGLERLVLSTLPTMVHAQALYRSLGFVPTEPYVADPTEGVLFYELPLGR